MIPMPQALRKAVYSGDSTMALNQNQQREIAKTLAFMAELGKDYGARALSALYRSARTTSQQNEILAIAIANGLVSSDEFVI